MDSKKDTIGKELKDEMEARSLSVLALAKELGIPHDRIYKWFKGESSPKFADRQIILRWIGKNRKNVPNEELDNPMPVGGLQRTLRDYVEKIESDNAFFQRLMESSLVDISDSLKKMISSPAPPSLAPGKAAIHGRGKFAGMSHVAAAKKVDGHSNKQGKK